VFTKEQGTRLLDTEHDDSDSGQECPLPRLPTTSTLVTEGWFKKALETMFV